MQGEKGGMGVLGWRGVNSTLSFSKYEVFIRKNWSWLFGKFEVVSLSDVTHSVESRLLGDN